MLERWVQGFWFGKRFTTDEHIIGAENDKVVRTSNVHFKSLEDTWSFEEIERSAVGPIILTHEKLTQEKNPRIEEPTLIEESMSPRPSHT